MFWINWKILFICTFFDSNIGLPELDIPAYRRRMDAIQTEQMDKNQLQQTTGSRKRTGGNYIMREEYSKDKSDIMGKVDQNTQNITQYQSRIDENTKDTNDLTANTIKRCESKLMRVNCVPFCCTIDGGPCVDLRVYMYLDIPVSFSKAFHKTPSVAATTQVTGYIWPGIEMYDSLDYIVSGVTSSGFKLEFHFSPDHTVCKPNHEVTWMACA